MWLLQHTCTDSWFAVDLFSPLTALINYLLSSAIRLPNSDQCFQPPIASVFCFLFFLRWEVSLLYPFACLNSDGTRGHSICMHLNTNQKQLPSFHL